MARGYPILLLLLILTSLLPTGPRAAERTSAAVFDALPHEWRDDNGASFDLQTLRGQQIITTMAYAGCHRICPMTIQQLQLLQRRCDELGLAPQFVIVGYDPETDDAAAWRHFRRTHGLNRPNWHFLVGSPQAVKQFASILGFEFWKVDDHVMHDSRVVYLDDRGAVLVDPQLDFLNGPQQRGPTPPTP